MALQSAVGGLLSPIAGAIAQEGIDLLAVLNALRMVHVPSSLTDSVQGPPHSRHLV